MVPARQRCVGDCFAVERGELGGCSAPSGDDDQIGSCGDEPSDSGGDGRGCGGPGKGGVFFEERTGVRAAVKVPVMSARAAEPAEVTSPMVMAASGVGDAVAR